LQLLPLLLHIVRPQQTGQFVEIGAYNGIDASNTLVLERCFGWRGLLVEGNSYNFHQMQRRSRRTAHMAHSMICAGNGSHHHKDLITRSGLQVAGQVDTMDAGLQKFRATDDLSVEEVSCQSLTSLMDQAAAAGALRRRVWTLLSCDVEGAEERVLAHTRTSDFSVALVETAHDLNGKNARVTAALRAGGLEPLAARVGDNTVYVKVHLLSSLPTALTAFGEPAAGPPRLRVRSALPGYCATTSTRDAGVNCDNGEAKGAWPLRGGSHGAHTLSRCLQRCAACPRCRFVSFSVSRRECGWFAECDLERLTTGFGFQTLVVRGAAGEKELH